MRSIGGDIRLPKRSLRDRSLAYSFKNSNFLLYLHAIKRSKEGALSLCF